MFQIFVNGDRRCWRDQESTAIDAGCVLKDRDRSSEITVINLDTRQWVIIQPVDYFLIVWFILAALATVYVAIDQFRNSPEPTLMR